MPVPIRLYNLEQIFNSFYNNHSLRTIFTNSNYITMDVSAWWPFFVVIALFVLAIVSPWIFPNKMVSKNKHDNKF